MLSIATVMKQAVSHHQKGHIQQSIALYNAVLQHVPDHADANRQGWRPINRASIRSRWNTSCAPSKKTTPWRPTTTTRCAALRSLSQLEAAIRCVPPCHSSAIKLCPGVEQPHQHPERATTTGNCSRHLMHGLSAPTAAPMRCNAVPRNLRCAAGDLVGSLGDHRQIVQNNPNAFQPLLKFGILAHELGDDEQALAAFERARDLHSAASTGLSHDPQQAGTRCRPAHMADGTGKLSTDWSSRARAHRHVAAQLFSDKTIAHDCLALPPSMHKQPSE